VDVEVRAFEKLPFITEGSQTLATTVHGSITHKSTWDQLPRTFFDLILFGHVFYYLKPEEQIKAVDDAYSKLSEGGKLVIIFNEGGQREEIIKHFNGHNNNFNPVIEYITANYQAEIFLSREQIVAYNLETALHIASAILNDGAATAENSPLSNYLGSHNYNHREARFEFEQTQKIIIIGQTSDQTYSTSHEHT